MTSTASAFGETLQFITDVKLNELEKRRQAYAVHAATVLANAQKQDLNLVERLSVLLAGIKAWPGMCSSDGNSLKNIENWVDQVCTLFSIPNKIAFSLTIFSECIG